MRHIILAALLSVPALASAQDAVSPEVFVRAGGVKLWDDEGNIGTGLLVSGGVGVRLPGGIGVEGLVESHPAKRHFDSGVKFDSEVVGASVRFLKYFGASRVPYAGGGIGLARIKTTSAFPDQCGFNGENTFRCLGMTTGVKTATSPAFSGFAGMRIVVGQRGFVRPEVEVTRAGEHLRIGGTLAAGLSW